MTRRKIHALDAVHHCSFEKLGELDQILEPGRRARGSFDGEHRKLGIHEHLCDLFDCGGIALRRQSG